MTVRPSAQVPFECPRASSSRVPKCLECPSAQVPFECWSTQVPLELPWSALKYLKIQESLRSEDLTEYYLCKGICFSLLRKTLYKHKVKQIIELAKTV